MTLCVDEDTDQMESRWKRDVFNLSTLRGKLGVYHHFLVTPEQFFKTKEGYYSRFGRNVRERAKLQSASRTGMSAFHPAYGRLNEIKVMQGFASVPQHALTATAPPHIYDHILSAVLKPDHSLVQHTSNRPNTIYATHKTPGTIDDTFNYDMFLKFTDDGHYDFNSQPQIILFFDNKNLCKKVQKYLVGKLATVIPCRSGEDCLVLLQKYVAGIFTASL
ncbi:hypothetical protein L218DRAFT_1055501 [Marasmius fiardii PR-910]|nr:hypothetical protein L218DRAFT_1055501 [Marasmius fiardii PR-910]